MIGFVLEVEMGCVVLSNFGNDRIAYDDYEGRYLSGDRTLNINGFQFDSLPNASYIFGSHQLWSGTQEIISIFS